MGEFLAFGGEGGDAEVVGDQEVDAEDKNWGQLDEMVHDGEGFGFVDVDAGDDHDERDDDGNVELPDEGGGAGNGDKHGEDGLHHEGSIPGGIDVEGFEGSVENDDRHGPGQQREEDG